MIAIGQSSSGGTVVKESSEEKIGRYAYVVGGLAFIPLFGIAFGIFAIVWGLLSRKKGGLALALFGLGGIAFSCILYGTLFYKGFVERGGVFDELRLGLAKSNLTSLVQSVEFYKLQNGNYPETLEVLKESMPKDQFLFIQDPIALEMGKGERSPYFYYDLIDTSNAYYLFSVGPDGKPFTSDDILPEVDTSKSASIGFRVPPKVTKESGITPEVARLQQEAANKVVRAKELELKKWEDELAAKSPLAGMDEASIRKKFGKEAYAGKTAAELHGIGKSLFQQKRYPEAVAAWLFEADKDQSANTLNNIGIAYKYANDFKRGLEYSRKAVAIDPRFGHGYMSIGRTLMELGRYEEARENLLKALDNNWKGADTYFNLGLVHQYLNQEKEAQAYFKKVKTMNPDYPEIDKYID